MKTTVGCLTGASYDEHDAIPDAAHTPAVVERVGQLLVPPNGPDHVRVHPHHHRLVGSVHPPRVQLRLAGVLWPAWVVRGRVHQPREARDTGLRRAVLEL